LTAEKPYTLLINMKDLEKIYGQSVRMAGAMSSEPSTPRTAGRQKKKQNRAEAPLETIEEY